jgi:L-ascorbate metabolism protein UlaG (beta-lactamase superfamily)
MKLTWIGHSTVVFDVAGTRLITDPLLRSRVVHLRRHAEDVRAPDRVDAVLLSHLHHDHLDLPSLRSLGAPVVGPPGTRRALRARGFSVTEMRAGNEREVGSARIEAVQAVHEGRRWPFTIHGPADAIGFIIDDGSQRVYFAGDTELFDGMAELGRIDVALLPIWGWGPRLGPGHMDPEQAAHALTLLQPKVAVPIHWGTFLPIARLKRYGHLLRDPGPAFREHAAKLAPDVRVEVLEPGSSFVYLRPTANG